MSEETTYGFLDSKKKSSLSEVVICHKRGFLITSTGKEKPIK